MGLTRIPLSAPDVGELEERFVVDADPFWLGRPFRSARRRVRGRDRTTHGSRSCRGAVFRNGSTASCAGVVGSRAGDFVPTSTLTFVATANAISYTGATPVFVDCDPMTGNIDPGLLDETIADLLGEGDACRRRPVDLLGKCANYWRIKAVAASMVCAILSDAAESLGASTNGVNAGAWGDAAILSFNGNKIMTTSGGGMLLTGDSALADHVRFLSTQAREPADALRAQGNRLQLPNVERSRRVGSGPASTTRRDDRFGDGRLRDTYADLFAGTAGVQIFQRDADAHDNCWLTAILVDEELAGWGRADLQAVLARHAIESRPLWKPMHLQPLFTDHPAYLNGSAEHLFRTGLALPSGSSLDDLELERIFGALREFLGAR